MRGANPETFAKDAHLLGSDLLQSYAADVLELRVRAPRMTLTPSMQPLGSPLARLQLKNGGPVTNLRHEAVLLDSFGTQLLPLLDGTRDRDALVAALSMNRDTTAVGQANGPALVSELPPPITPDVLDGHLSTLASSLILQ